MANNGIMDVLEKPAEIKPRTLKQTKFLNMIKRGVTPTEAALRSFDCKDEKSAAALGNEYLKKLGIDYVSLLESMGLTAEQDAKDLISLRSATKPVGLDDQQAPDNAIRYKALELTLKLKGQLNENNTNNIQVNMIQIERYKPSAEFIDVEKKD